MQVAAVDASQSVPKLSQIFGGRTGKVLHGFGAYCLAIVKWRLAEFVAISGHSYEGLVSPHLGSDQDDAESTLQIFIRNFLTCGFYIFCKTKCSEIFCDLDHMALVG